MKPQMRRMLAYVIARIVAQIKTNTLYDYQEIAYFNYNSTLDDTLIYVQDNSDQNYMKGQIVVEGNNKKVELYDPVSITKISIDIEGSATEKQPALFTGIGRGHAMKFHGEVTKEGKVSFYDSSTGMYYKLKI